MTLNVALVISGDASGARQAVQQTSEDVRKLGTESRVSASEMASANASAEAAMQKVTAVLTGTDKAQQSLRQSIVAGTAANDNATKQNKLAAHEMTNLTYQMNDMAMMLMSGQSPYMVMLQQGAQVSQIMGPRGLGQIIPAVGAALVGLINPTTLLLAGMTAVGYGAKYVFDQMKGDIRDVDDVIAEHRDNIRRIKDTWGEAADGLDTYQKASRTRLQVEAILSGASLQEQLEQFTQSLVDDGRLIRTETEKIKADIEKVSQALLTAPTQSPLAQQLYQQLHALYDQLEAGGSTALVAAERFKPFKAALDDFAESVRAGTPDYIRLQEAMARGLMADPANKELRELYREVTAIISKGVELQGSMQSNANAMDLFAAKARLSRQEAGELASVMSRINSIALPPLSNREQLDQSYREGRERLLKGEPDRRAAWKLDQAYRDALQRIENAEAGALVPIPTAKPNVEDVLAEQERAATSARNAVEDLLTSQDSSIERMRVEIQLVGDSAGTRRLALAALEAEQQIRAEGLPLHSKEAEAIRSKSKALAELSVELDRARLQQSLRFDLSQVFRSEEDQQIASILKGAGLDLDFTSIEAQLARTVIRATEAKETFKGFFEDVFDGLRNGKDVWESFADAGVNALDRIGSKLMDQALDQFFNLLLGNLLGGSALSPNAWNAIQGGGYVGLYTDGGYTGPGPRNQPAGIVHAGEVVWSQDDVARAGGVQTVEAMRLGRRGYESGGAVEGGFYHPANSSVGSGSGGGNGLSVKFEIVDRAGVSVEQTGPALQDGDGSMTIPLLINEIEKSTIASMQGGALGRATAQTFGLTRKVR